MDDGRFAIYEKADGGLFWWRLCLCETLVEARAKLAECVARALNEGRTYVIVQRPRHTPAPQSLRDQDVESSYALPVVHSKKTDRRE